MMISRAYAVLSLSVLWVAIHTSAAAIAQEREATTPLTLDHNRLLVDADIQQADGRWRPARLWVDTGNPDFMVNTASVTTLGFSTLAGTAVTDAPGPVELIPPKAIRIGGVPLDIRGLRPTVRLGARQWAAVGADANLPSTLLRRYRVIIDYPRRQFALAPPSGPVPRGQRAAARIHPETGIAQIDARLDGESFSLALDIGASYSFVSRALFDRVTAHHPAWSRLDGATGAANMWGLWPEESGWPLVRVPALDWGGVELRDVGLVGLPDFFANGVSLGAWYSKKTAQPVEGFLGPNALMAYRVEIDFAGSAVYFERGLAPVAPDMDLVGVTLQPDSGGRWLVIGVVKKNGASVVEGLEPGDMLINVGALAVTGATMGRVVDALRGTPGDTRTLVVQRGDRTIRLEARVRRLL
jgi:hypothetical protein